MIIILYIFSLLCLVLLCLKMSNRDYFNITLIFLAGYLLSAICCLYNLNEWAINIQFSTIAIVFAGLCSFMLGSFCGKRIKTKQIFCYKEISIFEVIKKGGSKCKLWLAIFFDIFIIVLLYKDIVRIASLNWVSWGNLFYNFRANLGNEELNAGYSFIVNIGLRITKPLAFIYATIFTGIMLDPDDNTPFTNKLKYCIPIVLYSFQVILQGYRIQFIALIIAIIFNIFFFTQIVHNWKGRINLKIAFQSVVFFALICIGFYYIKFVIGKLQESNGVIAYVTNYFGGSLQLFDMYLQYPANNGYETFAAFINSLQKFGFFERINTVVQHEYRSASTGVYIGNVYTGFRNYYNDYGMLGVLFFSTILGYIFSIWYQSIKLTRSWNTNRMYKYILYSSLLYTIVFHFFTDYFFSLIGIGWLVNLWIFYVITILIFKVRIGGKKPNG